MPNYYETAPHVIAASIALPIVDIFAVALKFRVRRIQRQPFKADDWCLVPATVRRFSKPPSRLPGGAIAAANLAPLGQLLTLAIGIFATYGARHRAIGWPLRTPPGYQSNPRATEQETLARKVQYGFLLMYPLALGFTKISLLSLYKRIFSISRRTRVIIVTTIALVIAWMIALFFAELFQCNTKFWANWGSAHDIRTQCNRTTMIIFAVCLTDSIFDLTILVMPIPLIWQLSLSTPRKIGVASIFLLGVVTVTASLVRFGLVVPLVFSLFDADANHRFVAITTSVYWGIVEAGVGIFVACLPTLQFIFRRNRWRSLVGLAVPTPPTSADAPSSRCFKMKLGSNPCIHVDRTVDVTYANADDNPMLAKTENWVHNNRSQGGSEDIEMQDDIFAGQRRNVSRLPIGGLPG